VRFRPGIVEGALVGDVINGFFISYDLSPWFVDDLIAPLDR
jgi:hypothetical protein